MKKTKIVIVGAGFGGLRAARVFRGRDDLEVTVVDRNNFHTFQPLLYQVATAGLAPAEVAATVRSLTPQHRVMQAEVTGVDYPNRRVMLDYGSLEYDYLILALGGRTSYFGRDEWARHTLGLKSLADAVTLRNQILSVFEAAERTRDEKRRRVLTTFVIIGGGPTGVELAGAIAELRSNVLAGQFDNLEPSEARVILLEGSGRPLPAMSEEAGQYTLQRLKKLGVDIKLGQRATDIKEGRVTTAEETFEAATVIWAAGVQGNDLAQALVADDQRTKANRIVVDEDLRVPGHDRVYCVGDMSSLEHEGKPLPGLAPVAMQQGTHAARNVLRQLDGQKPLPFRYQDKGTMATVGRSAAVADVTARRTLTGLPAWLAWLGVHLYYLTGTQNRILVLMRWAWAYLTWKWGSRIILECPDQAKAAEASEKREPTEVTPR